MAVEVGWKRPSEPPITWDDEKIKTENFNNWALNALYSGMNNEDFKKISFIEIVKEVWTIFRPPMNVLKL